MDWISGPTLAAIIFGITYLGIIFTRFPKVNMDRTSAAFTGAICMVLFGVISYKNAVAAVDFNTILLLMGMMMMVAMLQLDGVFDLIAYYTTRWAKTRTQLLALSMIATGITSAFLVNDAAVLIFTPILIMLCRSAGLNPMPYLMGEIFSANIGSCLTITGNPQNMLIGINSGIDFGRFMLFMLPVVLLSSVFAFYLIKKYYKAEFQDHSGLEFTHDFSFSLRKMRYSLLVFGMVILGFFLGKLLHISIPMIALCGAALMIMVGKAKPSKVMKEVDWVLLLFFSSLFVVVNAAESAGIFESVLEYAALHASVGGLSVLLPVNLVMSQVVSNVPFTVLMLPMMRDAASEMLWIALAGASTLAGNATLIGAVANLIVAESAHKHGFRIRFLPFLKLGFWIALGSLFILFVCLWAEHALGLFAS